MTIEHYDQWVDYFNSTYPGDLEGLKLRECNLQRFLDQVTLAKKKQKKTDACLFQFFQMYFFDFDLLF